ncbi:hypothetical protein DFH27DRAFT_524023 [Peziza echinospora]|nr:hypothetical protein DFH27DRAFT_524023 [Peziza echinospora]
MGTSFLTMLNRLPIYSRPKEPAIGLVIGNPVLVETTNPNIPTIPIQPRYDHFGNSTAISPDYGNNAVGGKQLPPLPGQSSQNPPPRVIPFRLPPQPSTQNQVEHNQYNQYQYSDPQSPSPPPRGSSNAAKATNVSRKPAPGQFGYTPSPPKTATSASDSFYSNNASTNNQWDSYKNNSSRSEVELWGRRQAEVRVASSSPHRDQESTRVVRASSIDDWFLQKSDLPPLPPPRAPTRLEPAAAAPQLMLSSFAFEPLSHNSRDDDLAMLPSSNIFKTTSKRATEDEIKMYAAGSTDYVLKTLSESINLGRPQAPPQPPKPKDHITALEENRDAIIAKRVTITRELCDLDDEISPTSANALAMNAFRRAEIRDRIKALKADLAAVEKEIFDVGMSIHRAWKRRCKEGSEGPTHLWIHNVAAKEN